MKHPPNSQGSPCLYTGSAEDSYEDYIKLLLVSDPAELLSGARAASYALGT